MKEFGHFFCKHVSDDLKVALQILRRKFYKYTEKSSLYPQSLLILIHKTPVVEKFTTVQINTDQKQGLFLHEQLADLQTENTQTKLQT